MMVAYGSAQAKLVKTHGLFRNIHLVPLIFMPVILMEILLYQVSAWIFMFVNATLFAGFCVFFIMKTYSLFRGFLHVILFLLTISGWLTGFYMNMIGFRDHSRLKPTNRIEEKKCQTE